MWQAVSHSPSLSFQASQVLQLRETGPSLQSVQEQTKGIRKRDKAHGNPRPQSVTILMQAGPTCRQSLQSHKRKDLLKKFIVPVEITTQLVQIPIANINSKVVLICTSTGKYVVQQPNCLEHN